RSSFPGSATRGTASSAPSDGVQPSAPWYRKTPSAMAQATQIAPTLSVSDPPPLPPIQRENGASAAMPTATTVTTDQNERTDSGCISPMIEEATAHRTDRVTRRATAPGEPV